MAGHNRVSAERSSGGGGEVGELTWIEGEVGPWTSIHLVRHCTTRHRCARLARQVYAVKCRSAATRSDNFKLEHFISRCRSFSRMQTLHGDAQLQPDSDRASMSTRATGRDSSVDSTAPAAPAPAPAPAREQPVHFYPPQKEYMYADARQPSIRSSRASSRRERRSDPGVDGELFPPDPRPWPTRSLLYQYMPFRGMYHDVKRRLPFYLSDWYIAFLPQNWERVVGATIRMYFLKSVPSPRSHPHWALY